nr:unnamed protein product [Digitaria exilis]
MTTKEQGGRGGNGAGVDAELQGRRPLTWAVHCSDGARGPSLHATVETSAQFQHVALESIRRRSKQQGQQDRADAGGVKLSISFSPDAANRVVHEIRLLSKFGSECRAFVGRPECACCWTQNRGAGPVHVPGDAAAAVAGHLRMEFKSKVEGTEQVTCPHSPTSMPRPPAHQRPDR